MAFPAALLRTSPIYTTRPFRLCGFKQDLAVDSSDAVQKKANKLLGCHFSKASSVMTALRQAAVLLSFIPALHSLQISHAFFIVSPHVTDRLWGRCICGRVE